MFSSFTSKCGKYDFTYFYKYYYIEKIPYMHLIEQQKNNGKTRHFILKVEKGEKNDVSIVHHNIGGIVKSGVKLSHYKKFRCEGANDMLLKIINSTH
jgi:hypothetical protein